MKSHEHYDLSKMENGEWISESDKNSVCFASCLMQFIANLWFVHLQRVRGSLWIDVMVLWKACWSVLFSCFYYQKFRKGAGDIRNMTTQNWTATTHCEVASNSDSANEVHRTSCSSAGTRQWLDALLRLLYDVRCRTEEGGFFPRSYLLRKREMYLSESPHVRHSRKLCTTFAVECIKSCTMQTEED